MRARHLLVGPAVLALVLGACGTGALPKLPGQLASSNAKGESTAAAMDTMMLRANVKYVLADGVKVDETSAKAYKFDEASKADAERVAKAFGFDGAPTGDGNGGWSYNEGGASEMSASVLRNGTFSVYRGGSVSSGVACASPPSGPDQPPVADAPPPAIDCGNTTPPTTVAPATFDASEAKRFALEVLKNAGVDLPDPKVTVPAADGYLFSVHVMGRIDGQAVDGLSANVTLDQDKHVTTASGVVTPATSVGTYDLATLQRAVDRLNAGSSAPYATGGPEPLIATDAATGAATDGSYPSTDPTIITLTRATVGLMSQVDSAGAMWLVPAYNFSSDSDDHVVAAAAADKYIEQPSTPTTGVKPGGGSGGGITGGGTGGGVIDPAPPADANCSAFPTVASPGQVVVGVCASSTTVKVGDDVVFTITASDSDRAFTDGPCSDGVTEDFGDGGPGTVHCEACAASVADGPGKIERKREHTYTKPGTYNATFTATSGTTCTKSPDDSTGTASIVITVT